MRSCLFEIVSQNCLSRKRNRFSNRGSSIYALVSLSQSQQSSCPTLLRPGGIWQSSVASDLRSLINKVPGRKRAGNSRKSSQVVVSKMTMAGDRPAASFQAELLSNRAIHLGGELHCQPRNNCNSSGVFSSKDKNKDGFGRSFSSAWKRAHLWVDGRCHGNTLYLGGLV